MDEAILKKVANALVTSFLQQSRGEAVKAFVNAEIDKLLDLGAERLATTATSGPEQAFLGAIAQALKTPAVRDGIHALVDAELGTVIADLQKTLTQ